MNYSNLSKKPPSLVNPENFKVKTVDPEVIKKSNSKKLNLILGIGFILFLAFFLWNCKYGFFKGNVNPEPFSLVYNVNSV